MNKYTYVTMFSPNVLAVVLAFWDRFLAYSLFGSSLFENWQPSFVVAEVNFTNWLVGGTFVSTRAVWLSTLMVILILFTSNYTVIGYHGKSHSQLVVI